MMKELQFKDFKFDIENGKLNYFNIYNSDLSIEQYIAIQHYKNNLNDNIDRDQKLYTTFHDIEVYCYHTGKFKVEDGAISPISAITIYSNKEKTFHVYFLVLPIIKDKFVKPDDLENKFLLKLKKEDYLSDPDNQNIKIYIYQNDEIGMIKDCWKKIHEINDTVISGFNSRNYDIPYFYYRLLTLFNDNAEIVNNILSKYGVVKVKKNNELVIAGFVHADLRHLYVPRDEPFSPGLNYGKKRASYSLDHICEMELKIKKVDYGKESTTLDQLYESDPILYLFYNIVDVALIDKLDIKLKHIDIHNLLRRDMKTPMSPSFIGSSSLFSTYYFYSLEMENQVLRSGVVAELENNISEYDVNQIFKPVDNSINWDVKEVKQVKYRAITNMYPGAYVQNRDSILIDTRVNAKDRILTDQDYFKFKHLDDKCYNNSFLN